MRPTRSRARSAMRMAGWGSARSSRVGGAYAREGSRDRPMIGRIQGILVQKDFPQVVVSCGGVGYEIDVPMSTFYPLPRTGEDVTLLTHLVVREDAHLLFG